MKEQILRELMRKKWSVEVGGSQAEISSGPADE
jgi:hypothetical protein